MCYHFKKGFETQVVCILVNFIGVSSFMVKKKNKNNFSNFSVINISWLNLGTNFFLGLHFRGVSFQDEILACST